MSTYAAQEYRAALEEQRINWIEESKCRKEKLPRGFFFPKRIDDQRTAARYCYDCPVRLQCAEYACITETSGQLRHGVWGGLTEAERNTLMKQLHQQKLSIDAVSQDGGVNFRKMLAAYTAKIIRKVA